ncbi:VOC family protein [Calidifontibacter terrae]
MTQRLNPYLSFRDNAREAMTFYQQVFGGQLNISTFAEMGDESDAKDGVMHAMLETDDGFALMASDTPPGMDLAPMQGMSISLSGDETEALTGYWNQLSDGGSVTMPLEKQMWGDTFGMCTDKFGVAWMVNIAGEQQ